MSTSIEEKENIIISWNCNGLFNHIEDLKILTAEFNPTIICLQETHLKQEQIYMFPKYNTMQTRLTPSIHAHGGTLIAVRADIHHEEIKLQTNLQILAAKIYSKIPFTICTAYFPPGENIAEDHILSIINSLPSPFILTGDFNSHSTS